jgi:transposase-like protein
MAKDKKSRLEITQRRIFSEAFKQQKVQLIVEKKISVKDVSDLYGVSKMSVYRWLYQYSPHHQQGSIQVVQMESEASKTKQALEAQAQLERALGRKQL